MIERLEHVFQEQQKLTDKINELVEEVTVLRRTLDEVLASFENLRGKTPRDTGPLVMMEER